MKKLYLAVFAVFVLAVLAVPALSENVTGIVMDQDGKPIAKAKVICTWREDDGKVIKKAEVTTDSQGKFSSKLPDNYKGFVGFLATAANMTCERGYWTKENPEEIKIKLWPAQKIKGKIVDENGKPVVGAEISVRNYSSYTDGGIGARASFSSDIDNPCRVTTGKDGSFTLQHIPDMDAFSYGSMQYTVTAKGRALLELYANLKQMDSYLLITDPLACSINGRIHISDGSPVPERTRIIVKAAGKDSISYRHVEVDKDGKFNVTALPPGKTLLMLGQDLMSRNGENPYSQTLQQQPWAFTAQEVELVGGKSTNVDITPTPGAIIKVKVVDKNTGAPVPSAQVIIDHAGRPGGAYPDSISTDKNGEAAWRVVAGDVSVSVMSIGGERQVYLNNRPTEKFTIADGEEKSDIVIKVDPNNPYGEEYGYSSKPVLEDFELKAGSYELTWDPEFSQGRVSYTQVNENDIITKRIKALPKFVSKKPRCAAVRIDGNDDSGLLACALDESKGTGKGWDTVYIDTNRNLDLSDEQPLTFKFDGNNTANTDWVEVKSHQGSGAEQTQHPLKLRMGVYKQDKWVWVCPERKGAWTTKIESGKGPVECAIVDSDANGIYGNPMEFKGLQMIGSFMGDYAAIDTNGMGKAVVSSYGSQSIRLCDLTKIGDKFYTFKTNGIGNKLTVEPYTSPMGSVKVTGKDIAGCSASPTRIEAIGKNGCYEMSNCKFGSVVLPAGDYVIAYCDLNLNNKKGLQYPITCSLSKEVTVSEGKETSLTVGGKLSLAIDPWKQPMYIRRNTQESINWVIKAGDTTISSIGNSASADGPRVWFFDKSGKLVFKTTAGYT